MHAACIGRHRLPIDAGHARIARVDATRAGFAVIALNSHDLRTSHGAGAITTRASKAPLVISERAKIERENEFIAAPRRLAPAKPRSQK
jgi:hypothetical protein